MNCVNSTSAENDLDRVGLFADISRKYLLIGKLEPEDVHSLRNFLKITWWHLQLEKNSALLALCGQRPVRLRFYVFFDLHLNKRLCKQSRRRWFETPSRSLLHYCNGMFECIRATYANAYGAWLISTGQWSGNNCNEVRLTLKKDPFQCCKDFIWNLPILPIKIMIRKMNQYERFHIRPKCIHVRD